MALTEAEIEATKVPYGRNQFKVSDGGGLYLLVKSSGRYWKLAYRFDGKQKTLAFGVYPSVSLEAAREKREAAKAVLAQGIDPGEIRKQQRMEQRAEAVAQAETTQDGALADRGRVNVRRPALLSQDEREMVERRRLSILQVLVDSNAYSSNESALHQALDSRGYCISFDRLRTDVAWLHEQQAVQLKPGALWGIYLTQSGLDAAEGRTWIPGIMRPELSS